MEIRAAILKAADSIKRSPQTFQFGSVDRPFGPGDCACALGWVTYFSEAPQRRPWGLSYSDALPLLGVDESEFYARMTDSESRWDKFMLRSWMFDATACARALRAYADKYHPAATMTTTEARPTAEGKTETPDWEMLAAKLASEPRALNSIPA